MGNYKRTVHYPGKPDIAVREWRTTWLQPDDESRVPVQVRIYDTDAGWVGYYVRDQARLRITWMKPIWKEVPSPLGELGNLKPVNDDDDEETLEEIDYGQEKMRG